MGIPLVRRKAENSTAANSTLHGIAPAPASGPRVGRSIAARHPGEYEAICRAQFSRDLDFAGVRLRQHARGALRSRRSRKRDIGKFLVFKRQYGVLDVLMRAQPRQSLNEMTPIRCL